MYFSINAFKTLLGLEGSYRLSKNGEWRSITNFKSYIKENDMLFTTYKDAEQWLNEGHDIVIDGVMINTRDKEEVVALGRPRISFEVIVHRVSKPKNLFVTREQLKDILNKGNDSYNNSLVIDYNGFPQLLKLVNQMPCSITSYPVRLETYGAGNSYVGEHIELKDVEEAFMALLEAWNMHILTGRKFYRDYVSGDKKEEELINGIVAKTSSLL